VFVALVVGAAISLTSVWHFVEPVAAKPDPAFCSHVVAVRSTMAGIRRGVGAPIASELASEQQELAADATRLAATGRAVDAAEAAALATEVGQLHQAVLLRDPATARGMAGGATARLASVCGR